MVESKGTRNHITREVLLHSQGSYREVARRRSFETREAIRMESRKVRPIFDQELKLMPAGSYRTRRAIDCDSSESWLISLEEIQVINSVRERERYSNMRGSVGISC